MFGEKVSYLILRPLTHTRNRASEEELNQRADQTSPQALEQAMASLKRHISRFDGRFPLSPDLRYLDIGCGTGEMTVALAKLGCRHVTGLDYVPRNIETCRANASIEGVSNEVQFVCADVNEWAPAEKFDVLLSFAAFEHIADPRLCLEKMAGLVAPKGIAIVAFSRLFHTPFGDHMSSFFWLQIPWRGVLFSEKAILRLRQECYRPTDAVTRYQDIVGGLNLMRYGEFLTYVHDTGWEFDYLAVNPQLRKVPPLFAISNWLMRTPATRDYFANTICCILRRKA
jgi:SAM-dependent methyltransferase